MKSNNDFKEMIKYKHHLTLRVRENEYNTLNKLSEKLGTNKSDTIRKAIEHYAKEVL